MQITKLMTTRITATLLALALLPLSSCGTVNGVRWAYGKTSIYGKPDSFSESRGIRATFGVPVIVGGFAFDAVTFPAQALFGVWPWWGNASTHMKPKTD